MHCDVGFTSRFVRGLSLLFLGLCLLRVSEARAQSSSEAEVIAVVLGFHEALAEGDSTLALAYLAEDAVILEAGGIETKDDYRSSHLGHDMALWGAVPRERGPFTVIVQGDAAWAYSTLVLEGVRDESPVNFVAAELAVLAREAGSWSIRAFHWSTRQRAGSVQEVFAADAASIREARARSNDAIAAHDIDGVLAELDSAFHVTAGSGRFIESRVAMGEAFSSQFADFSDAVYVRSAESVAVAEAGSLGFETGTWVGTWTTSSGPLRTGGRYSASWSKTSGSWKIRSELFVTLFCEGAGCS